MTNLDEIKLEIYEAYDNGEITYNEKEYLLEKAEDVLYENTYWTVNTDEVRRYGGDAMVRGFTDDHMNELKKALDKETFKSHLITGAGSGAVGAAVITKISNIIKQNDSDKLFNYKPSRDMFNENGGGQQYLDKIDKYKLEIDRLKTAHPKDDTEKLTIDKKIEDLESSIADTKLEYRKAFDKYYNKEKSSILKAAAVGAGIGAVGGVGIGRLGNKMLMDDFKAGKTQIGDYKVHSVTK